MKLKTLAASMLLACAAGGALADDQTATFSGMVASFDSVGTTLAGGKDVITFNGLASGIYDFTLTLSGQYMSLSSASLNGVTGLITNVGKWSFAGIDGSASTPLVLTLMGTTSKSSALYSGELSVTAVPEPESYALFVAGLGALAFLARRRQQPQA